MSSQEKTYAPGSQPLVCGRKDKRLNKIVRVVFLSAVLGLLSWYLWGYAQAELAKARRQRTMQKMLAGAPPIDQLPMVPAREPSAILILQNLGELFVEKPYLASVPAYHSSAGGISAPQLLVYSVSYRSENNLPIGQLATTVELKEYPSASWARFTANYPPGFNPLLEDIDHFVRTKRFDNKMILDTSHRFTSETGTLTFIWPSANFVVSVSSDNRDVNATILRDYVTRYPSSL